MKTKFRYKGVREQLQIIIDYIVVMENSVATNPSQHLTMLISLIDYLKKQLLIYQEYELHKEGKKYGNGVAL